MQLGSDILSQKQQQQQKQTYPSSLKAIILARRGHTLHNIEHFAIVIPIQTKPIILTLACPHVLLPF